MNRNLLRFLFVILGTIMLLITSCVDDEVGDELSEFPPINRGDIEANRYLLTFIELSDTTNRKTVEFYDPDGIGGSIPTIRQTLFLKKAMNGDIPYRSEIKLFIDTKEVTNEIIGKATEYIVCYRGFDENNLRPGENNKDKNGVNLGTELEWSTIDKSVPNSGLGNINVTLNFQPSGKEGLCDPGIRILEGSIPYQLN